MKVRYVILGDIHAPYLNKRATRTALEFIRDHQPKYVIQVGDALDFFSISRWPRAFAGQRFASAADEVAEGYRAMSEIWRYIAKKSPKTRCYQLLGNHCDRLRKGIIQNLPQALGVVQFDHLFTHPGVNTVFNSRDVLEIDGIFFNHGWLSKLGDHAKYFNNRTVVGHTHRGGTVFFPRSGGRVGSDRSLIWELNAGLLADTDSEAMSYTPTKWNNWTHGIGVIWDDLSPQFLPFCVGGRKPRRIR